MLEIHKRGAANTVAVQNGDALQPAQAGSIRRGWQASKRHGEKEEDPPGAEETVKVQKWREKWTDRGADPLFWEFQGKQQEGGCWKDS